jgi:hypothetical protein
MEQEDHFGISHVCSQSLGSYEEAKFTKTLPAAMFFNFFSALSLSLSLTLPFVRLVIFLPVCMIIASFNTKILQSILIAKFLLDFLFYCLVKMETGLYIKR